MKDDTFCLVYTTVPDRESAQKISEHLLEKKLIACANLLAQGISFYVWEEKLQSSQEHILIVKTLFHKLKKVEQEILQLHPYECPCIVTIKAHQINNAFLQWTKQSLS